jgi:ABC-type nitrate/sulfonate/bicarbonate transport system ATPase subunit
VFIDSRHINFAYTAEKTVLNDISLSLDKGETLAIVGASGCGKSTLLRILSGILPNSKGNSLQGDISIDGLTPDQYRQTGKLAFMFQEATLMPHLTVKQNIELPLKIKGNANEQKTNNLIKAVGLEEYSNYLPKQLSGGMKTRVALARAFVTEPELLLLDEPFSALDIGWKNDLYKALIGLAEEFHTTLVIVTHDVQEAILLADKIVVLNRKGEFQATFKVDTHLHTSERVKDITKFVSSNTFTSLYSPLQQAIILEDERKNARESEVNRILELLQYSAGNSDKENLIDSHTLDPIRDFANTKKVHSILVNAFTNAKTSQYKYFLIWDILEYENLSDEQHAEYFEYYLKNIVEFSALSREWYKMHSDDRFFDILTGRIQTTKGNNSKKKWIYVCDLFAVRNLPALVPFLNDVINGKIEEVNFPLAKQAAQKIIAKIKNEKQDTIHIA